MVGMLQAIPSTPLYKRLQREGRLIENDPNCNFIPQQMTRDELREGFLVQPGSKRLYAPEASSLSGSVLQGFRVARVSRRAAPRFVAKAGEGRSDCQRCSMGLALAVVAVPGHCCAKTARSLSVGSVYVKYFFTQNLLPSSRRRRLRAVHEPLRDPLALLQVHPRAHRRRACGRTVHFRAARYVQASFQRTIVAARKSFCVGTVRGPQVRGVPLQRLPGPICDIAQVIGFGQPACVFEIAGRELAGFASVKPSRVVAERRR